jgi:hypothetical protein
MPPKKRAKNNVKNTDKSYKLIITGLSYGSILNEHIPLSIVNTGLCSAEPKGKIDTRNIEYIEDKTPKTQNDTDNTIHDHKSEGHCNTGIASGIALRCEYFFDSKKNKVKIWPTMVDRTTNDILTLYTNKPCKNCHHPYDTHPIGCPIKYVPHHSDPNDPKRKKIEKFLSDNNFLYDSTDYFEVEHLFCSFPCVKSYIMKRLSITPSSYKYTNALTYLTLLYKKLFSLKTAPIIPSAHDTDSLLAYGGHLSISEYRNTMGLLQFDKFVNTKRPIMFSSFSYMEETAARTEKDYM